MILIYFISYLFIVMNLPEVYFDKKLYYINYFLKQIHEIKIKYEKFINYIVISYPNFISYLSLCSKMQELISDTESKLFLLRYKDAEFAKRNSFVKLKKIDIEYISSLKMEIKYIRDLVKTSDKNVSSNRIYERMENFDYSFSQFATGLNELFYAKNADQIMFIIDRKVTPPYQILHAYGDYFYNYVNNFMI